MLTHLMIRSTLLTLFVVPVMYTLLDDAAAWLLSRRRARHPMTPTSEPPVTDPAFGD